MKQSLVKKKKEIERKIVKFYTFLNKNIEYKKILINLVNKKIRILVIKNDLFL